MSELIDKVRDVLISRSNERSVSDVLESFEEIPEVNVKVVDLKDENSLLSKHGVSLSMRRRYMDGIALGPQYGGNFAYLHRNDEHIVYKISGPKIEFS